MKVNGNLTLSEGGVIHNLTLPSGTAFPANGNLGEKFRLTQAIDANTPAGEYTHNGTGWDNLPELTKVKSLIAEAVAGGSAYFRPMTRISTLVGALGIGTYFAMPNIAAVAVTTTLTNTTLNMIYLDPADFPAGAKLRIAATYSQNNTGSAAVDFTVGLRKVGKPATTGGTAQQMIYQVDASDAANVTMAGGIASKAMGRIVSTEFDIPAAGFYTFVITLSGTNNGSGTHWDIVLQAKY